MVVRKDIMKRVKAQRTYWYGSVTSGEETLMLRKIADYKASGFKTRGRPNIVMEYR